MQTGLHLCCSQISRQVSLCFTFANAYVQKMFVLLIKNCHNHISFKGTKIVSEYDQEIPQSQTADNPVASRGRASQPSRDTRKTN